MRVPVLILSAADALIGLLEQARADRLAQFPLKISTTGLNPPRGPTITESPLVTAEKENQISCPEEEVTPLHGLGGKDWVALALE